MTGPIRALALTRAGAALLERLPYERHVGDLGGTLRAHWRDSAGFVVVAAVGAVVRLVAPLLGDKVEDPAVVVLDEQGRFCVPVLGGHAGGANQLAQEVAALLGAEPVLTTASDAAGWPALDDLPGWTVHGPLAAAQRALLDGAALVVDQRLPWPLPGRLGALAVPAPEAPPGDPTVALRVDDRACPRCLPGPGAPEDPAGTLVAHPPSLVVGLGCATSADAAEARALVQQVLLDAGLSPASVAQVATIDRRAEHPAVRALGRPVLAYPPEALAAQPVPHPSAQVAAAVGTPSVAEAAALLGAGPAAELLVPKVARGDLTVAVARRPRPVGRVTVVGVGPGAPELRTPRATAALRAAEVVVGYEPYLALCRDALGPGQDLRPSPIGQELDRVRTALEAARAGRRVALVCSGDPGVFALASPLLELAAQPPYQDVPVDVEPGLTAALVAAARLGAPLAHDFCCLSLSDLLTPWERIEARLEAAGRGDLAVVLYNPRSARRTWQLPRAAQLLLAHRPAETPVGVASDLGRPEERVRLGTLAELADPAGALTGAVTMTSLVVVGASTTRRLGDRLVTPRGYPSAGEAP
ncbi:precorrin-3B C(17)-methyltransferase [Aciditerrimonas ferrireducens]|uniref:precorrin-3B C(17)-methyltransferase n=1 Tax=Aciditerrimonas ferrireducens TaxID=667306 RepID=UPI0028A0F525|nr:precorrin-3B C(17)-methyltransferase [Aciditerrimonas ferrireducens]